MNEAFTSYPRVIAVSLTRVRRTGFILLLSGFLLAISGASAAGQLTGSRALPKPAYYNIFPTYYAADYADAKKYFDRESRTAFRMGDERFLDSVCFWTMLGECNYHMGNHAEAVAYYEQGLALYLAFQRTQWQARVQPPPQILENNSAFQRAKITWGTPVRRSVIARMPDTFSMLYGRLDSERAFVEGGPVDNAEIRQVNVTEIMRCVALSLHRRRVIKGPTCKFDPFTAELVRGLSVNGAGNGTVLGSFNGILLGIAQASADNWGRAAQTLKRSLQFSGGMDHPLTPIGLVELAQIELLNGELAAGAESALEASYSAALFGQPDLIEEALSTGTTIHLIEQRSAYPPLQNAIAWARREKVYMMQASLTVRLAECLAEAGDATGAANVLSQTASAVTRRNSLPKSVISARGKYVAAVIGFLNGNFDNGLDDLADSLDRFQNGSLWLYRLGLANQLVADNRIQPIQADQLYTTLLRDPAEAEWLIDPMESMAFLTSNHVAAMEQWFDILIQRRRHAQAVDVAELIRRHRFYSAMPLGGRLMAFRWVMNADEKAVNQQAMLQRKRFLGRNGNYKSLSDKADLIKNQLLALPFKPAHDSQEARKQKKLVSELAEVSLYQEAMLASFALRREPADLAFPPQKNLDEFQAAMQPGQLAISTLETASGYHVFFVTNERVKYVDAGKSKSVKNGVSLLLRKIGALGSAADPNDFESEEWKEVAEKLKKQLLGDVGDAAWDTVTDLVIIPDGVLWYMPFEIFQIGPDGAQKHLCEKVPIRYCPTLYLSSGTSSPLREIKRTGVVTARLHPRGDVETTDAAMVELVKAIPDAEEFKSLFRLPSNYFAWLADVLVVWSEMDMPKNMLDFRPMQIDQAKIGTTLSGWLSLPWWGPEHVALPGMDPLGRSSSKATGAEMFMTSTGLMAAGSRSVLMPRWSVGGGNSLALTRMYTERLSKMSPSVALREAVTEAMDLDFNADEEPRVKKDKKLPPMKANAPFFWASYMVVEIPFDNPVAIRVMPGNNGLFQRPGGEMPPADPAMAGEPKAKGDVMPGEAEPDEPKLEEKAEEKTGETKSDAAPELDAKAEVETKNEPAKLPGEPVEGGSGSGLENNKAGEKDGKSK